MSLRDALNAEKQESSSTITTEAIEDNLRKNLIEKVYKVFLCFYQPYAYYEKYNTYCFEPIDRSFFNPKESKIVDK